MKTNVRQTFGANLLELITEKGMNRVDFARANNIQPSMVGRWISGENLPDPKRIDMLSEKYRWTLKELFSEQNKRAQIHPRKRTTKCDS